MGHSFQYAISQMAQTTLRSVIGQSDLDELLAQRDKINHTLREILDKQIRIRTAAASPFKNLKRKAVDGRFL